MYERYIERKIVCVHEKEEERERESEREREIEAYVGVYVNEKESMCAHMRKRETGDYK